MKIFRSPAFPALLLFIFLVAGLLGGPENAYDVGLIRTLAQLRTEFPNFTIAAVTFTHFGSAYATLGLGAVAAAFLWWSGRSGPAMLLAGGVLAERIVMDGLKIIVGRPRPSFDAHPVMTHSSSFPSGHAANSMAAFLIVALIAAPPRLRLPATVTALVIALLMGASRPYLGVHWPSDIIGGWALGLLFVWLTLAVGRRSGSLPDEAKH
jgi:undecaprenyl-diphosphatase